MGWSFCTGNRNLDAPDGKHCEKSENLASADTGIRNYRSGRNLYLPSEDEWCGSGIGMGTCGLVGQIGVYTGWVNDIAEGTKGCDHRNGLGRSGADLFYSSGSAFLGDCDSDEKMWLDQGK